MEPTNITTGAESQLDEIFDIGTSTDEGGANDRAFNPSLGPSN